MTLKRGPLWGLLFVALSVVAACTQAPSPPPAATPTPALSVTPEPGTPGLAVATLPPLPERDLYDLARRYRGALATPPSIGGPPPQIAAGNQERFNVLDLERNVRFEQSATVRQVTEHLIFYVADGIPLADEALARSARQFEERTYPILAETFGEPRRPGLNGDARYTVLIANIPGVAGYYSAGDEYPSAVYPYSNERHMMYLNNNALQIGTSAFDSVLAHEFQHALHWQADRTEESWLNEGLSELASYLAGYPPSSPDAYLSSPDVSLLIWPTQPNSTAPHYAAAYLFFRYLLAQGLTPHLTKLVAEPANGRESVEQLFLSLTPPHSFDEVFGDWLVANVLNQQTGQYGYEGFNLRPLSPRAISVAQGALTGSVAPYGADYLEIRGTGEVRVSFQGRIETTALATSAPEGRAFWWSQRGDGTNPRLTRALDLTTLREASLTFRLWYDLEEGWDYAYVAASADDGMTWRALEGLHTTNADALGLAYGPGYTGRSNGWLVERFDLSPYAGKHILVRFEVVHDDGVHRPGLAVDDIAVPELAFADGAENDDGGWTAEGFLRTDNRLPVRPLVRLIEQGETTSVHDLPVGPDGSASLDIRGLGGSTHRAFLVISALAPLTAEPLPYQVQLNSLP